MKAIATLQHGLLRLGVVLFLFVGTESVYAQVRVEHFSFAAYHALDLPKLSVHSVSPQAQKIRIAVVDDGFNLTHELIKPFLAQAPLDPPNNRIDDDENGYVDDAYGWNVADDGPDVSITEGLERKFFHGTMVASIISTVFREIYGDRASGFLELVPVKAVSHQAQTTLVKDGYKGIAYAIACGVDIICCAWSGGELSVSDQELLEQAEAKGITVIGSAGNLFNKVLNPAAHNSVIAVTAIDSTQKLIPTSNFGPEIDFVAQGDQVRAGHPLDPRAYFYGSGSSASVALVSGVYGILASQFPAASKQQIVDALKYTALPVNQRNPKHIGNLGAGIPQVGKALTYLANPLQNNQHFNPKLSEGAVFFFPKDNRQSYTIQPSGAYYGIEFQIEPLSTKKKKIALAISTQDTQFVLKPEHPRFLNKHIVRGSSMTIKNLGNKNKAPLRIRYEAISIDSSTLYCKDTQYLYAPKKGLEDGSGKFDYSHTCDCKWLIEAPQGKRIKLQVTQLDTEPNVDFLWVFNGEYSMAENLLAKFSGQQLPPIIISPSNKILLWFLTDEKGAGKGWRLNYDWVD